MADKLTCSVRGCGKQFLPGSDGAGGRCWVHYMRARRNSPNANVPELLHRGNRSEKLTVRVTPELAKWAERRAAEDNMPLGEWIATRLELDRLRTKKR